MTRRSFFSRLAGVVAAMCAAPVVAKEQGIPGTRSHRSRESIYRWYRTKPHSGPYTVEIPEGSIRVVQLGHLEAGYLSNGKFIQFRTPHSERRKLARVFGGFACN